MEHRWVVWVGFLIVVAIGLTIGFSDWQSPTKLLSKVKPKTLKSKFGPFGRHVFSSKTLRNQEEKD